MPKARSLERRRHSIQTIRKITRTMELVSTARFRRVTDQAAAATAYGRAVTSLVARLVHADRTASHPLLESRRGLRRAVLLVLTANRGLCGGYNTSVLRLAYARLLELRRAGGQVQTVVSGRNCLED